MFERFTDQARRALVLAQEEARSLGHAHVGTEHVLLGLVKEGEGLAAQALGTLEITLGAVRKLVGEIVAEGAGQPSGHIPFTPRTKKVLELSLREAQRLGDTSIGTEHLLLGLVREGEGAGVQVLERLGAGKDRVLAQVLLTRQTASGGELRRVAAGPMHSPQVVSRAGLGEVMSRLDEISQRLATIESLLAGTIRRPEPAGGQAPPGGTESPGDTEPPAQAGPPAAQA